MARLLTRPEVLEAIETSSFIQNGDKACIEGVSYDFRLGNQILKASFRKPVETTQLTESEKEKLHIEPGELIFVLSVERLALPGNIMAQLTPKRNLTDAGVTAVGRFSIDRQYEGRKVIGLYNFSSKRFPILPGRKMIAATFYELSPEEQEKFPQSQGVVEDFPPELIQAMQDYFPERAVPFSRAVDKLRIQVDGLIKEIRSDTEWYRRFETSLHHHHDPALGKLRPMTA